MVVLFPSLIRIFDYLYNPFIWNSIILASSKFSARVGLAALLMNIEIEVGNVLAYTSICSSWEGLVSG
jgi:hypothetical protein